MNSAPGVRETVDFYKKRGFKLLTVYTDYPLEWAADPEGRRLHVVVSGVNPAAMGAWPECQALPHGPTVVLSIR